MRHLTELTLAALLILLGACGPAPAAQEPNPSPLPTSTLAASPTAEVKVTPTEAGTVLYSPEELVGIWDSQVMNQRAFYRFREDGSFVIAYTYETLDTKPVFSEPSKFWFEGETFNVEDDCGHGTYVLTLTKTEDDSRTLAFRLIDDPCGQRKIDWKRPMRWVRP